MSSHQEKPIDFTIRTELLEDRDGVASVITLAFDQPDESDLVDRIRESEQFYPQLSLVAVANDSIVGHVLFSAITIASSQRSVPALALAPVAVLPAIQSCGIGTALIKKGLNHCRELGHSIVIVLGHEKYYPRFGFVCADHYDIKAPFDVPREVFMALELCPNALKGVSGTVRYPSTFGLNT